MSAYEKIAAEACQWCKIGKRRAGFGGQWHDDGPMADWPRCAAPTKDALIERLVAERDAANNERNQMERLLKSESEYRSRQLMAADEINNRLRADNQRLREALEKAPHAPNCKSLSSFPVKCKRCKIDAALCPSDVKCFGFPEHEWVYRGLRPCSCWKAALASPAQETEASGELLIP